MRGKTNRDTIKTWRIEMSETRIPPLIPLTFANFKLPPNELKNLSAGYETHRTSLVDR